MSIVPWTALQDKPIWNKVIEQMQHPKGRHYHNMQHVLDLYNHAAVTFKLPYDPDLDLAILTHDVIYDAGPFKELRSIEWLDEQGELTAGAEFHIRRTVGHHPCGDFRMVLLDLADLAFIKKRQTNYELIRAESMELYNCTEAQFAFANWEFMSDLRENFVEDRLCCLNHQYKCWFRDIEAGIRWTIVESERRHGPFVVEEWDDVTPEQIAAFQARVCEAYPIIGQGILKELKDGD